MNTGVSQSCTLFHHHCVIVLHINLMSSERKKPQKSTKIHKFTQGKGVFQKFCDR